MVEVLAGFGIPQKEIAQVLGIALHTLMKHYAVQLEHGAAKVHSTLVGNIMRLAKGSDGTALKATMFALQTRFGWSAYAPRPASEQPLGKKELAEVEAQTAHEETDWGRLIN